MPCNLHLQWKNTAHGRFRTGVSLHSHTLHSRERLDFIYRAAAHAPLLAAVISRGERRYCEIHGTSLDLARGWWTPPLGPHDAWLVEKSQIESFDLSPLVSLTDHDNIEAPVSLHLLEECRATPISCEWTVPFRSTFFHIGVHGLPPATARTIFAEMSGVTSNPAEARLGEVLALIAAYPESLIVFNHPLWDEKRIGQAFHTAEAQEFLRLFGESIHALELNGLRPWRENRDVITLGKATQKPAISGGDRHALEPNAILNLSNAGDFSEFVEEVRAGWSDVLVLRHYREPYGLRIFHNMMDVLRTFEQHANGWRNWSDRVFYQCDDGTSRSLTELFGDRPPAAVALFVGAMQLASAPQVRRLLRGAFPGPEEVAP